MTKEEILLELQNIKEYMEANNAFHGYGQMTDLINELEQDQNPYLLSEKELDEDEIKRRRY